MLEFAPDELGARRLMGRPEVPFHLGEGARRRILKREDRLLFVADGKNRALDHARARPGKEFRGQPAHDLPLLGARVLRFVDQHVVDAAVELVVHPGGALLAQ